MSQGGLVMRDDNVRVTCALVDHPPVVPAFAYRFDTADRSIVISGDTNRSENLIKLAQGADVLVHEALYVPAVEDCGRVATAAGVKTLVLSHLVPADDPTVTEQTWLDAVRPHFKGQIIVARDLMEI
jgi:ribonuclease BN (tRNA processing enzyme)